MKTIPKYVVSRAVSALLHGDPQEAKKLADFHNTLAERVNFLNNPYGPSMSKGFRLNTIVSDEDFTA